MRLLSSIVLTITLLLTGCAVQNVKPTISTADLQSKNTALLVFSVGQSFESTTFGAAMVRFTKDAKGSQSNEYAQTYDPSLPMKADSEFKTEYGLLKVVEVPAGAVDFYGWTFTMGNLKYESRNSTPIHRVNVKAGDVVYVGNFYLKPSYGPGLFGLTDIVLITPSIVDQHERDIALFASRYPKLPKPTVSQLPVGVWADPSLALKVKLAAAAADKAFLENALQKKAIEDQKAKKAGGN